MPVVMETCYRALENYNNCADPQAKDYRLKEGVLVMIGMINLKDFANSSLSLQPLASEIFQVTST